VVAGHALGGKPREHQLRILLLGMKGREDYLKNGEQGNIRLGEISNSLGNKGKKKKLYRLF